MGVTNGVIYSRSSTNGANTVKAYNSFGAKNIATINPKLMGPMYPIDEGYRESKAVSVSAGTTVLVSGVAGKSIEVDNYTIVGSGASVVRFLSGSTNITGTMMVAANGNISANTDNGFLFKTAVAENLSITTTNNVGGHLSYRFV